MRRKFTSAEVVLLFVVLPLLLIVMIACVLGLVISAVSMF
jgi:hypothetical protein